MSDEKLTAYPDNDAPELTEEQLRRAVLHDGSVPIGVFHKIKESLDWRGPTGKKAGHVVLTRDEAEALRRWYRPYDRTP